MKPIHHHKRLIEKHTSAPRNDRQGTHRLKIIGFVFIQAALTCQWTLAAETRESLLEKAQAYWRLGDGGQGAKHPLAQVGSIELNEAAEGEGARAGAKVARLNNAYFDAGKDLNIQGNQCTVYVRARDPRGEWGRALITKRGAHSIMNFNLFSNPGIFGFELHGDEGTVGSVSFPLEEINAAAWHDLIGRYDGTTMEIICDGQIMASRPWNGGNLTQNEELLLIGAETRDGIPVRAFTGEMEEAAIWPCALSDEEIATLIKNDKLTAAVPTPVMTTAVAKQQVGISPLHLRPKAGAAGDVIAFFWQGQYHLFYLYQQKWIHNVSTDLIQWKELPPALTPCSDPLGPDPTCWTGSIVEHNDTFYLFYTGQNQNDPKNDQKVMLAKSKDLIQWQKQPESTFYPDGKIYWSKSINGPPGDLVYHHQAFRDPDVFWNEEKQQWWMLLHALALEEMKPCVALYTSSDLKSWTPRPPLITGVSPDCPHAAPVQGHWFIIAAKAHYISAASPAGRFEVERPAPGTLRYR